MGAFEIPRPVARLPERSGHRRVRQLRQHRAGHGPHTTPQVARVPNAAQTTPGEEALTQPWTAAACCRFQFNSLLLNHARRHLRQQAAEAKAAAGCRSPCTTTSSTCSRTRTSHHSASCRSFQRCSNNARRRSQNAIPRDQPSADQRDVAADSRQGYIESAISTVELRTMS